MLVLLSEIDERLRCTASLQLASEMSHPTVQVPQLGHAAPQLLALSGKQCAELIGDFIASSGRTRGGQLCGLIQWDVELAKTDEQAQGLRITFVASRYRLLLRRGAGSNPRRS